MNNKIKIMAGLVCALTLTSCGKSEREETIQRAREVISSHSGYDKNEGELLIYEKSENNLGLVTIYLEPGDLENMNITIRTEVTFNSKYNSYVNDAQMVIDLYAKTDYRYNLTFAMKGDYDYKNYTFPFMYSASAKVGEEYVKGLKGTARNCLA